MGEISEVMDSKSADPSVTRIFVSGLPPSMTTEQLRSHFSTKFTVTDAHVLPERCIGFIGFADNESAVSAVKYFNRSFVKMSKISVTLARPVEVKRDATGQATPVSLRRSGKKQDNMQHESRKRKREANDDGEKPRQENSQPQQRKQESKMQAESSDAAQEEVPSAENTQAEPEDVPRSDSDWLRGKTSRLLDLVEDGVLGTNPLSTGEEVPTSQPAGSSRMVNEADITGPTPNEVGSDSPTISIPNARLFVRNLPFNTSQDSVRATFSPYGRISEVS